MMAAPAVPTACRRRVLTALLLLWALLPTAVARGQAEANRPAFELAVGAAEVVAWQAGDSSVLLLRGNGGRVTLTAGGATLEADDAVVWLTKLPRSARRRADVALIGGAAITTAEGVTRSGPALAVDVLSTGRVAVEAAVRRAADESESPLYQEALAVRDAAAPLPADPPSPTRPATTTPAETVEPAAEAEPTQGVPVALQADSVRSTRAADGTVAIEATGGVFVLRREGDGGLLELRADRAVLFTALPGLDASAADVDPAGAVRGVYLEGDVRANLLPEPGGPEQRLRAETAYYDLQNDQATLTRAVLHTRADGFRNLPITVRADLVRQLGDGRYEARSAEVSTTRFATPSYSLNAGRVFVRVDEGGPGEAPRTTFGGDNFTLRLFEVPVFYFPIVRGASLDLRLPLRDVDVGASSRFGPFVATRWGLFETLGFEPPRGADATYALNYYGDRGPAGDVRARWGGDFALPLGGEERPSLFAGRAVAEGLIDRGETRGPGARLNEEQDGPRGRFDVAHAQFFPAADARGGESLALFGRLGLVGDPLYVEEFERNRFQDGEPHDFRLAVSRSRQNERTGLELRLATTEFPTIADHLQENALVERLPELTYARFGDRLGPVTLTGVSRVGLLSFDVLSDDLDADFNFPGTAAPGDPTFGERAAGQPSYGYTGRPERLVARLDTRQEASLPFTVGPVRLAPFAVGRATAYGDSPDRDFGGDTAEAEGGALLRGLAGAGVRAGTAFARVDDSVYSRVLGLDRARHLIEPYGLAFAAATNAGREAVYAYDEGVDGYDGFAAVRAGVRQRWQTYRGPPGFKRSADVVDVDVRATLFADAPDRPVRLAQGPGEVFVDPYAGTAGGLRGMLFDDVPEASLPRDTAQARAAWRVTDTTALVGDATYVIGGDDGDRALSTAAGGLVVDRYPRLNYSLGGRYVGPLDLTRPRRRRRLPIGRQVPPQRPRPHRLGGGPLPRRGDLRRPRLRAGDAEREPVRRPHRRPERRGLLVPPEGAVVRTGHRLGPAPAVRRVTTATRHDREGVRSAEPMSAVVRPRHGLRPSHFLTVVPRCGRASLR